MPRFLLDTNIASFGLALLPAEARVHQMADSFLNQISTLTWDSRCAQAWATLAATQRRAGQTLDMADAMIAAHAIAYDLVLVSNDAVFALVDGLKLQDWTKGPQPA